MQFLEKTTSLEKTIKETILFFLFEHTNITTLYLHEKLFFFQKLLKLLETKLFKGDIFVFSFSIKHVNLLLTKNNLKSYKTMKILTHKKTKREITLSKPNKAKAHKGDSRMFYLIKNKSRAS